MRPSMICTNLAVSSVLATENSNNAMMSVPMQMDIIHALRRMIRKLPYVALLDKNHSSSLVLPFGFI